MKPLVFIFACIWCFLAGAGYQKLRMQKASLDRFQQCVAIIGGK